MTTQEPTTAQKITVLKHLINGHEDDFISDATGLSPEQVEDIKSDNGYPVADRMRWGLDLLSGSFRAEAPARGASGPDARASGTKRPVRRNTDPRPATVHARAVKPSANELIAAAADSKYARTRNLGTKVACLLGDLSRRLDDEQKAAEEAAREAAEEAKIQARISELQGELDELKAKARTKRKRAAPARLSHEPGAHACTSCDRTFDTSQGRSAHERRTHQGFDPRAIHRKRHTADVA